MCLSFDTAPFYVDTGLLSNRKRMKVEKKIKRY